MANKFKYNKTGSESNSIFKGNWAINTSPANTGGGPSSTTGFYNGAEIPSGGYVIYNSNGKVFKAANDAQLLAKVGQMGGDASNISAALAWLATQPGNLALDKTLDNIVTSGLVLNLDASALPSYPASGTSLYDLSNSDNHGTLINGPTYSSDGGGSIDFDGVDDYINHGVLTNVNSTSVTTEVLVRFTGTLDSNDRKIFCYRKSLGSPHAAFQARKGNGTTGLYYQFNNGGTWYTATLNNIMPLGDTWYHYTFVHDGYQVRTYRNGELFQTDNFAALIDYSSVQNFLLGYRAAAEYWKGDISNLKLYNKALSQSEVTQNYNAQKSRFGL